MSFWSPFLIESKTELERLNIVTIDNIIKAIDELNLDNIHKQFYAFCYLLWNGYFSVDKEYFYNDSNILDEENTIFLGRGCCRHNAKLLEKVYRGLHVHSKKIGIRLLDNALSSIMDIEQKIEESTYDEKEYRRKDYNHSIVIVTEKERCYLFDSTTLTECEVLNNAKLFCIDGKYKINKKLLKKDLNYILYRNFPYNKKPIITNEGIKNDYTIAHDICIKNSNYLNEFYEKNRNNYQKIKQIIYKNS